MAGEQNGATPGGPKTPSKTKGTAATGDAATPTPTPKKRRVATPKSAKAAAKGKKDVKVEMVNAEEDGEKVEETGNGEIAEEDGIGPYVVEPDKGAIMAENVSKKRKDPVLYDSKIGVLRGDF